MPLRGITFDLDGTLADTLPICYAAFRSVFLEYTGREYTNDEIHALFGPCEKGAIQRVIPDWRPAAEAYLREYESCHSICTKPFEGIIDTLDWLAQNEIRVAVVTGKGAESAEISLRRLGLAGRFEFVEAGEMTGPVKSKGIRRILERWRIPPEQGVHIGDAPSDVRSARECGVGALAAAWSPGSRRDLLSAENPDALFESVGELLPWIQRRQH